MASALNETGFWILTSLTRERRHGYAILRDVERLSEGEVTLRVTTLYAALERLVESELIRPDGDEVVEGRARRYYALTPTGRQRLAEEAQRLSLRARAATAGLAGGAPAIPFASIG